MGTLACQLFGTRLLAWYAAHAAESREQRRLKEIELNLELAPEVFTIYDSNGRAVTRGTHSQRGTGLSLNL